MPFEVVRDTTVCPIQKPWAVKTKSGPHAGNVHGCFRTRKSGLRQAAALYAATDDLGPRREGDMPGFELRMAADGRTWNLRGYASKTNVGYRVTDHRGTYVETIKPGAFRSTLTSGADVVLATEHAPPFVARTPRTMTLTEDSVGLLVDAELDREDPDVQALVSKVRRGVLPEMSFAFRVSEGGDIWSSDRAQRTIRAADLDGGDVSVVRRGANRATEVSVRGTGSGIYEVRAASGISIVREMTPPEGTFAPGRSRNAPTPAELRARGARLYSAAAEEEYWRAVRKRERRTGRTTNVTRKEAIAVTTRLGIEARRRGDRQLTEAAQIAQAVEIQAQVLGL